MIVRLNGKEVQHGYTEEMLFSFAEVVSYISQQVTLHPGDLLFSGSTGVTVALKPGDSVDVEIPNIGTLSNSVEAEPSK
jgi:2-keto-4-pentenoate hydratase/2-oxohepta-3-ene-1,7-dioic acid hydratase in catechol pathway